MKKILILSIAVLLLISSVSIMAYAHSGGTDSNGGHYDRSTGEYHYHHGYPAHQHTGGVCPYRNSGSDWMEESERKYQESLEEDDDGKDINWIAIIVGTVAISLVCTGVVLLNLGVIDKLSNVVSNILLGVWIVLLLAAMVCLINAPGAIILIGIFEGIGAGLIFTAIEERREKKKTEDSNEKTSRR